jgi:two-component system, NarL family, vancomycin resistance associated response regulator VraR
VQILALISIESNLALVSAIAGFCLSKVGSRTIRPNGRGTWVALTTRLRLFAHLSFVYRVIMLSCMRSALRVLVVDDHELTRLSLKLALQNQSSIELVGLASNGKEAVDLVKDKKPDVIIIDLQMPVLDGLSASAQIKTMAPQTRIIAYSSVDDPQTEVMIQTANIDAFCKKDVATQELVDLVKRLGQGVTQQ